MGSLTARALMSAERGGRAAPPQRATAEKRMRSVSPLKLRSNTLDKRCVRYPYVVLATSLQTAPRMALDHCTVAVLKSMLCCRSETSAGGYSHLCASNFAIHAVLS